MLFYCKNLWPKTPFLSYILIASVVIIVIITMHIDVPFFDAGISLHAALQRCSNTKLLEGTLLHPLGNSQKATILNNSTD